MTDPQQNLGYPYMPAYAPPVAQPPPARPVPSGRLVPYFWAGALILLTIAAIALAIVAPFTVTRAPVATGGSLYQNSLAQSDNAWQLRNDAKGQCSYANGGLDVVTTAADNGLIKACLLQNTQPSDLRLSVRLLPQVAADAAASAAIFIHSSLVFYFPALAGASSSGEFAIYNGLANTDVFAGETVEWHASGAVSNTIVITAQSDQYALYVNGVQVWHDTLDNVDTSGNVALGVFAGDSKDEAVYTDFSLANP